MENHKLNFKNIIKVVMMIILSNIFFYLIFFNSEENTNELPTVKENYIRLIVNLESSIPKHNIKIPITLYNMKKEEISHKAFIIKEIDSVIISNEYDTDHNQNFKKFIVDVDKTDLKKVIKNRYLLAFPYTEQKHLKRSQREIIF